MAASDKDIVISPQRGSTTNDPSIVFTGDGNDPISVNVLDSTTGSLSFEGSAGQLFSITNNLTSGSIFSVNDVSGIPSLDINADGTILLAEFGGDVGIGTDNPTAKLDINGTLKISGNISNNGDNYITFGPNSTWSNYLRIGGNGYQGNSTTANIAATNGNLHIDAATSSGTFLNYYAGTAGVGFGDGGTTVVAWMGPDGDLWKGSADNSGSKYWHEGNDGPGTGLDADKLDNQEGSYYLNTSSTAQTKGNSTDSRANALTLNYSSTATFSANSDIGDNNRILTIQNPSTTTSNGLYAALHMQVGPTVTERAMGDIKFVRDSGKRGKWYFTSQTTSGTFTDTLAFSTDEFTYKGMGIKVSSGTFTATAGSAYTAETYAIGSVKTAEYTLFFEHSSGIQSQKVLVMDNGTTAYSQEYAIMSSNDLLISVSVSVSSGNVQLLWTPETGVNGTITYKFNRETIT